MLRERDFRSLLDVVIPYIGSKVFGLIASFVIVRRIDMFALVLVLGKYF
jgi:hypothetical protein